MKKYSFCLVLLLAMLAGACGDDSDEKGDIIDSPDNPEEEQVIDMSVSLLTGTDAMDHAVPRMVVEWEKHMIAQIADPRHPDVMILQYAGAGGDADGVALVSKHNIIFMHYNPARDDEFPADALVASDYDGFSSLTACTIDWVSGDMDFGNSIAFESSNRSMAPATRGDDDNIKALFFNMFDEIGSNVGKMKGLYETYGPLGTSATTLCDAWSKVIVPLMQYQLYEDDELARQQFVEARFKSQVVSAVNDNITGDLKEYLCKLKAVDKEDVNFAIWAYDLFGGLEEPLQQRVYERWSDRNKASEVAERVSENIDVGADVISEPHTPQASTSGVRVTLTVGQVTETSIGLAGAVKIDDSMYASVAEAGFVYYAGNSEVRVKTGVDSNFNIKPTQLTGLEPGTTYRIAAYYESAFSSKTFYSDFQTVTTLDGDSDLEWAGTKWHFVGTLYIDDSEDGQGSKRLSLDIDLTGLDSGNVTFSGEAAEVIEGSCSTQVTSDGTLIIKVAGTSHEEESGDVYNDSWSYTFTLHRLSTNRASMVWEGSDNGTWYDAMLKQSGSYTITLNGQFDGTLIE